MRSTKRDRWRWQMACRLAVTWWVLTYAYFVRIAMPALTGAIVTAVLGHWLPTALPPHPRGGDGTESGTSARGH